MLYLHKCAFGHSTLEEFTVVLTPTTTTHLAKYSTMYIKLNRNKE